MKKYLTFFLVCFAGYSAICQSLIGAWEAVFESDGQDVRMVVIFTEEHQVAALYDKETGAFISTNGGGWFVTGNTLTERVEFDSSNPERVGSEVSFEIELREEELSIVGDDRKFVRLDAGEPGALAGAWLINSRIVDGLPQGMDPFSPRKTMKILSGTRFQWIAFNTETGDFRGTGGGTYTTKDGKYTENIEFFSRDNTRVGASLEFNYEIVNGDWRHSGKSSKGNPIDETWGRR